MQKLKHFRCKWMTDYVKQTTAVVLAALFVSGAGSAQTVIPGDPIVVSPVDVSTLLAILNGQPVVTPIIPLPKPIVITGGFTPVSGGYAPTSPNTYADPQPWAVSTSSDGSLNISTVQPGNLRAPVAVMTLSFQIGFYDSAVGQQMGCSSKPALQGGKWFGQTITCPLISKIRPTTIAGEQACYLTPKVPNSYDMGERLPMVGNSLCLTTQVSDYSNYYFRCGTYIKYVADRYGQNNIPVSACDAVDVKFPIMLNTTSVNKSGKVLYQNFTMNLQDADNRFQTSVNATFANSTAITNPDDLGWVKPPKPPKQKSCDEGRTGPNMSVLLGGCTDSKGVQIAQRVMVAAAALIVGAFAGPVLSGVAGEVIGTTTGLRFIVVAAEEISPGYTAFLG